MTLTDYVCMLREKYPGRDIPSFDYSDGGTAARVLFLLEAPGPRAVYTGKVSIDNPDQTAGNMRLLLKHAKIPREECLFWNVVPWYLGDGKKIRPARKEDIKEALPDLLELIKILPRLRVIVLMGRKAWEVYRPLRTEFYSEIYNLDHPSPQVLQCFPKKMAEMKWHFRVLGKFLGHE